MNTKATFAAIIGIATVLTLAATITVKQAYAIGDSGGVKGIHLNDLPRVGHIGCHGDEHISCHSGAPFVPGLDFRVSAIFKQVHDHN